VEPKRAEVVFGLGVNSLEDLLAGGDRCLMRRFHRSALLEGSEHAVRSSVASVATVGVPCLASRRLGSSATQQCDGSRNDFIWLGLESVLRASVRRPRSSFREALTVTSLGSIQPAESRRWGGALNERSTPRHAMRNGEQLAEPGRFRGCRSLREIAVSQSGSPESTNAAQKCGAA
jgi:hypothetical protein